MNPYNENNDNSKRSKAKTVLTSTTGSTAVFRSMNMSVAPPPPVRFLREESPPAFKEIPHISPSVPRRDKQDDLWTWKMNQLHPVPLFHPLERCAATMENLSLDTATSRISNFMKDHSITCCYHSDEGYVDCMTDSLLKFVVQLWKGNTDSTIIMEVQRRQGCCIEMHKLRSKLIPAVCNGDEESSRKKQKVPRSTCHFLETLLDKANVPAPPPSSRSGECLPAALEICCRLLESERLDENRLGLESLVHLTDPSKVASKDADQTSRTLLSDPCYQDFLQKYFVDTDLIQTNENDDATTYKKGEFFGSLHLLSLKILSQALESVAHNEQSFVSIDLSSLFWKTILQALYCNLQVASHRPLEASVSIRCLRILQTLEPTTLGLVPCQSRLREFLSSARQYGRDHSRSLEQETEKLIVRLESVH